MKGFITLFIMHFIFGSYTVSADHLVDHDILTWPANAPESSYHIVMDVWHDGVIATDGENVWSLNTPSAYQFGSHNDRVLAREMATELWKSSPMTYEDMAQKIGTCPDSVERVYRELFIKSELKDGLMMLNAEEGW